MNIKETYLSKAIKNLIITKCYYGIFLIGLNKKWSTELDTAGVSKLDINYQLEINESFWLSLTDNHRIGILLHEVLHIAFGHLTSYTQFSNHKIANVAMDMEINQLIDKGLLPGDELSFDQYINIVNKVTTAIQKGNLTNEEILIEKSKIPCRGIMFEDYVDRGWDAKAGTKYYYNKLIEAEKEKSLNGTTNNEALDNLLEDIANNNIPQHGTWKEFENLTEAETKLIIAQTQKLLTDAKEQTLKSKGIVPNEIEGLIVIAEITPPKFDWKGYIRKFTGVNTKVYTKQSRRKENTKFPDNLGLKIKKKSHLLLAIDTSGSVTTSELTEFMNEIHHIYKLGVEITIIQCDSIIQSIKPYKGDFELTVYGRGGTKFNPVIEYYNDNYNKYTSLIYFTDGECNPPIKPKGKILWVLSERSSMNKNLPGFVIKLEM